MNENDGHEMLVARMKALEAIAIDYMTLYMYESATHFDSEKEIKQRLEKMVETRAPGCSNHR